MHLFGKNQTQINRAAVENTNGNYGTICKDFSRVVSALFQCVNLNHVMIRIDNPVFTNSSLLIKVVFSYTVIAPRCMRKNFNYQIRCAVNTVTVDFRFVTYDHKIRLQNVRGILRPVIGGIE